MSAEDFAVVREALVGPGGMKRTPGHAEWLVALAALARLEARIAEYENAITWCTSCLNCSKLIDTNYAQYVELEQSKTRVEALTAVLRELEDAVRAVLRTDIWICDSPFHGPTLTFNGTTKTQVWDNLAAALATSEAELERMADTIQLDKGK